MKDYSLPDGKLPSLEKMHVHGPTAVVKNGAYGGHRT